MNHPQKRQDEWIREIVEIERKLHLNFEILKTDPNQSDITNNMRTELEKIKMLVEKRLKVCTSKELDYVLQMAMMYISCSLYLDLGFHKINHESKNDEKQYRFLVTTSLYRPARKVILMKSSQYSIGACSTFLPAIPIHKPIEINMSIGISGVAALTKGCILCRAKTKDSDRTDEEKGCPCPFYIPYIKEGKAHYYPASLAVPLVIGVDKQLDSLRNEISSPDIATCNDYKSMCHCEYSKDTKKEIVSSLEAIIEKHEITETRENVGVLSIECTRVLEDHQWRELLQNTSFRSMANLLNDKLKDWHERRQEFKNLRRLATPIELMHHNLRPREAYKALLREMSEFVDGADVSLHFRDSFDVDPNERNRCIRLIDGVGENFRSFLVNFRHGMGQGVVGRTINDASVGNLPDGYIFEEILENKSLYRSDRYIQLMPDTQYNAAVPIFFGLDLSDSDAPPSKRVIGCLNFEWSRKKVDSIRDSRLQDGFQAYFNSKLQIITLMADFFSLVIDYYDDLRNLVFEQPENPEKIGDASHQDLAARLQMQYYTREAMKRIRDGENEEDVGKQLADAIGYYLGGINRKYRFQLIVRKKEFQDRLKFCMPYLTSHSFNAERYEGTELQSDWNTVMTRCAEIAFPIFGDIGSQIKDVSQAVNDQSCGHPLYMFDIDRKCNRYYFGDDEPKDARRSLLGGKGEVTYSLWLEKSAEYEFAAPLIFGGKVLGAIDVEFFRISTASESDSQGDGDIRLDHRLVLEWARIFSFCMASLENRSIVFSEDACLAPIRRFYNLCAQIIANVSLEEETIYSIAETYFENLLSANAMVILSDKYSLSDDIPSSFADWQASAPAKEACIYSSLEKLNNEDREPAYREFRACIKEFIEFGRRHQGRKEAKTHSYFSPLNYRGRPLGAIFLYSKDGSLNRMRSQVIGSIAKGICTGIHRDVLAPEKTDMLFTSVCKELVNTINEFDDSSYSSPSGYIRSLFEEIHRILESEFGSSKQPGKYGWFLYLSRKREEDKRFYLNSGNEQNVKSWAGMPTEEMESLIELVNSNDKSQWKTVLSGDQMAQLERLFTENEGKLPGKEAIVEWAVKRLTQKLYPTPVQDAELTDDEKRSITYTAASQQGVLSFPDMTISPYRSKRNTSWFFKDKIYAIVSIPFILFGSTIGVLNILRRRERWDDFDFFNNEEIEKAKEIKETFETRMREVLGSTYQDETCQQSDIPSYLIGIKNTMCAKMLETNIAIAFDNLLSKQEIRDSYGDRFEVNGRKLALLTEDGMKKSFPRLPNKASDGYKNGFALYVCKEEDSGYWKNLNKYLNNWNMEKVKVAIFSIEANSEDMRRGIDLTFENNMVPIIDDKDRYDSVLKCRLKHRLSDKLGGPISEIIWIKSSLTRLHESTFNAYDNPDKGISAEDVFLPTLREIKSESKRNGGNNGS